MGKKQFKRGDKVTWKSTAGFGQWKTKSGKVVEVVAPGESISVAATRLAVRLFGEGTSGIMLKAQYTLRTDFGGGPRDHESYLVAVRQGPKAKPALYWPRVSALQEA